MAAANESLRKAALKMEESVRAERINSMMAKHISDKKVYSGQIQIVEDRRKPRLYPVRLSFESLDKASGSVNGRIDFVSMPKQEFHRGGRSITYGYLPISGVISNGQLVLTTPDFAGCAYIFCGTSFKLIPNETGAQLEDKEGKTTMRLSL